MPARNTIVISVHEAAEYIDSEIEYCEGKVQSATRRWLLSTGLGARSESKLGYKGLSRRGGVSDNYAEKDEVSRQCESDAMLWRRSQTPCSKKPAV